MFKKLLVPTLLVGAFFVNATTSFAYTVKSGDTMNKIANSNNVSLSKLISYNPQIKDPNVLKIGQNVNTTASSSPDKVNKKITLTASEKDLLARLVRAEAESEPQAGKVAVAVVVLNRTVSGQFPSTVTGVINQSQQFTPVSNGEIKKAADTNSVKAVNEALTYSYPTATNSLFFYNSKTATSRWLDSRPTTVVIGQHTFKK